MMKVNLFMSMYNYTRYLRWYAALTNVHTGIVIILKLTKSRCMFYIIFRLYLISYLKIFTLYVNVNVIKWHFA